MLMTYNWMTNSHLNSFKERSSVVVNLFVVSISRFIFVLQAEHKHFEPGHSSCEWMEADEKQF